MVRLNPRNRKSKRIFAAFAVNSRRIAKLGSLSVHPRLCRNHKALLGVSEMAARKLCLFCDKPSDGKRKEDVLPVWIQKKMKGKQRLVVTGHSGDRPVKQQALEPTVKSGCVCYACNSGWMSELEGKTRKILGPLMEGINLMLDEGDKHLIAIWAVKTAMTLSSLGSGRNGLFYTRDECAQFRKSFLFPRFTQVWLGRYGGNGRRNLQYPRME